MYGKFIKPFIDKVLALIFLILLSPFTILLVLITWFNNSGVIFFTQQRPGLNGKPFMLIKFKTMNDKLDANGKLLPNLQRTTRVGNFMREMSLDEIPQLINVLKGELSLVGPRPLEMRYLELYSKEQNRRHNVKPGITGWAQINGRNNLKWEERFNLDTWYVDHLSFCIDMTIMCLTFWKVIKREGINSDSLNTVVPFDIYLQSKSNKSKIKYNDLQR